VSTILIIRRLTVNRHTHFNLDALNQQFTTRFSGSKDSTGLPNGIPTMSVFDQEMKNSFKSGEFTLRRRLGLLDLAKFFDGWLSYGGYGVARNGKYAVKQGGRDLEAMHIHYFLDTHGKTVVQYKYCERDGVPYLPTQPIAVCRRFLSFF
jgi:hypothetical protein